MASFHTLAFWGQMLGSDAHRLVGTREPSHKHEAQCAIIEMEAMHPQLVLYISESVTHGVVHPPRTYRVLKY